MQTDERISIVLTGGGSGGHITPLLAVADELKRLAPSVKLIYIGQSGDKLADIPRDHPNIDESYFVMAGKFRRFHGEGLKQLLDFPTLLQNIRDFFYVLIGIGQSYFLLKKIDPSVIFIKGGYIGVPVGIGAAKLKIKFITHDSDAIPGLANRIISRWATLHAVALPEEVYPYPSNKTITTGIPLQSGFKPLTSDLKKIYRKELRVPSNAKIIFVIGGGLGAQRVNEAISEALPHLLNEFTDLYVFQSVGRAHEANIRSYYEENLGKNEQERVKVFGYINDVYKYSGSADIVVTRAGATNLAEFSLQGSACLVIPNPLLTGGHQTKNADYLAKKEAVKILKETDLLEDPNRLAKQLSNLLKDTKTQHELSKNIKKFAKPHAAHDLANLILKETNIYESEKK